jgi:hypothetical protein
MGVAAAVAVVGALSVNEQRKAAKSQKKARKIASRKADLSAARERREVVRQARVRRADVLSQSALTGAGGSSSESGAIGSLQGQLGSNIGSSLLTQDLSGQQSKFLGQAARHSTNAAMFGTLASMGSSFIGPSTPNQTNPVQGGPDKFGIGHATIPAP